MCVGVRSFSDYPYRVTVTTYCNVSDHAADGHARRRLRLTPALALRGFDLAFRASRPCETTTRCERCPAALAKINDFAGEYEKPDDVLFLSICLDDEEFGKELVEEW